MKKINLNVALKNLKGENLLDQAKEITEMRELIANALSVSKPKQAKDIIKQYKLAMKIFEVKEDLTLEEAEYEMIKDILEKNELNYTTLVLGQILEHLNTAEHIKV
jgi:hypothetical protein